MNPLQFTCAQCGRKFYSSEAFVQVSKGLCPTCTQNEGVPRCCVRCGGMFVWHERFARVVGHPSSPQQVCPTCEDRQQRAKRPAQPVIVERVALHVFPHVQVCLDMESTVVHDILKETTVVFPQLKVHVPCLRLCERSCSGWCFVTRRCSVPHSA